MHDTSARSFLRRLGAALLVAVLATVFAIGGAYVFAARKVAAVPTVAIDTSLLEGGNNYLLIGSDSRAFVDNETEAEHFGDAASQSGQRSDTIMVAHVDGGKGTGFLVSFPRDLWVDIPGIGNAKINAAFNKGPQRLIETLRNNFDIPIGHYLEVDFAGFRDMVDAIGTVPVPFSAPTRDIKTGLDISEAGCQRLDGAQSLAYVRSRYFETFQNGAWHTDPTSDLGRIQRQQGFVRILADEAIRVSQRAPWKGLSILDKALASMQRDPKLGLGGLRKLAYGLRGESGEIETLTVPTQADHIDGQSVLVLDQAKAAPLFTRLRAESRAADDDAPAPPKNVAPTEVRVAVQNGGGRTGAGGAALTALQQAGFAGVGDATNADRSDYDETEVRYAPDAKAKGQLVLSYLGGAGRLVALDDAPAGTDVVLVVGRDLDGVAPPATNPATRGSTAPVAGQDTASLPTVTC
jgi:polyisoprenyl-teichoic acid--peptidoglycan teichoic acid transferase